MTNQQVKIISPEKLSRFRYSLPLPRSWLEAAGILKGKKIRPLSYQKRIRKEWEERLKKLSKIYSR